MEEPAGGGVVVARADADHTECGVVQALHEATIGGKPGRHITGCAVGGGALSGDRPVGVLDLPGSGVVEVGPERVDIEVVAAGAHGHGLTGELDVACGG